MPKINFLRVLISHKKKPLSRVLLKKIFKEIKTMLQDVNFYRFIGIYENKTKKNYDLNILSAVYLRSLKKLYDMYEKKELVLKDDYFITTLQEMAKYSGISLYYQEKIIQELEKRELIEYDPLEFDKYDEGADQCVMFKIKGFK